MSEATTWREVCVEFSRGAGVAPAAVEVLSAFRSPAPRGGPPPPPDEAFAGDFVALERTQLEDRVFAGVVAALDSEIDGGQAELFARRLRSVDQALARAGDPTARVLRVGLRVRAAGILRAPGPRALRLRALADFYYSHLGRHLHMRDASPGPALAELVAGLRWREVGVGLEHGLIDGPSDAGPIHLNVLRVDPRRIRVEAHDCRGAVASAVDFASLTRERGAVAAVSGGFFLYSESDIEAPSRRYDPVGLLLSEGALLSPPVFRRGSVLISEAGEIEIARLGLDATSISIRGRALTSEGAVTRAQGRRGPARASVAIVGREVVAVGEALPIPLNGFVLPTPPDLGLAPGDAVDYGPVRGPSGQLLRGGVAGGPLLVEAGRPILDMRSEDFWGSAPPVTFSQDETGDHNLLPRLAAGLDGRGRLILAAIDGRNFERALGMTLAEVGGLMIALGCERATNLDGGSSKRMVLRGQTLDLTSTEIQAGGAAADAVRPVHTALSMIER